MQFKHRTVKSGKRLLLYSVAHPKPSQPKNKNFYKQNSLKYTVKVINTSINYNSHFTAPILSLLLHFKKKKKGLISGSKSLKENLKCSQKKKTLNLKNPGVANTHRDEN